MGMKEDSAAYDELDIVVQAGRLKALQRVRLADDPNPIDLLVVAQWRAEIAAGRAQGVQGVVKTYAAHWGAGAGGLGIAIALIEAVGKIFGR